MIQTLLGSRFLWIGAALLALGTGPLVITGLLDPTSNNVGFGMLTFFTFWASILLMVVGLILGVTRAIRVRSAKPA
jgi:hypothetical protein